MDGAEERPATVAFVYRLSMKCQRFIREESVPMSGTDPHLPNPGKRGPPAHSTYSVVRGCPTSPRCNSYTLLQSPFMAPSVIAAFTDALIGGFFRTIKQKVIDAGLVVGALVYWLLSGKLRAHFWENVLPWIWVICVIVTWHSIKAARDVIESHPRATSTIFSPSGSLAEVERREPHFRSKVIALAAAIVVVAALFSYSAYEKSHQQENPGSPAHQAQSVPNLALFMKCDLQSLPITIPASSAISVIPLNERYMKTNKWGSYEIHNQATLSRAWPDKQTLAEAEKHHDFGAFGYRCELSNHGQVNVIDVVLPMRFWFGTKGGDENAVPFAPVITPLDAGKSALLYLINDCPTTAAGVLPDEATVQIVGESTKRRVKLNLPNRNPADQIMMWFPSKSHFVGVTQCN